MPGTHLSSQKTEPTRQNLLLLIITDPTELDEQIEKVFHGVDEDIYRTKSGADLVNVLNASEHWLICSLIHKFGNSEDMKKRERLKSGNGNALLVSGSIYSAFRFFEMFQQADLKDKCAIVTPYKPSSTKSFEPNRS